MTHSKTNLTVGGKDPHVLECDHGRALHDHFDRLLAVRVAHVTLALRVVTTDGGLECEVVGTDDMNTSNPVVVHLQGKKYFCPVR